MFGEAGVDTVDVDTEAGTEDGAGCFGRSDGAGVMEGGAGGEAETEDAQGEDSGDATRVWHSGGAATERAVGQNDEAGEGDRDV